MRRIVSIVALLVVGVGLGGFGAFVVAVQHQNFGVWCLGMVMVPVGALCFGKAKALLDEGKKRR